jgi:hypothetical protein
MLVFDVADPNRHGKIINAGPEVTAVKFDDDVRYVGNQCLRAVEAPADADDLDNPSHDHPEATAIHDGQQAWARLHKYSTWKDWKDVGAAHVQPVGAPPAMSRSQPDDP